MATWRRLAEVGTWVLALLTATPAVAQELKDALGDPLPKRALHRLGTTRLVHADWLDALAWSPDAKTLAAYSAGDTKVLLWAMPRGDLIRELKVGSMYPSGLAFSADGQWLAFWGRGLNNQAGMLRVWDVKTGNVVIDDARQGAHVTAVAFAPGKAVLAVGRWDGAVQTWDLTTGKEIDGKGVERVTVLAYLAADRVVTLGQDDERFVVRDLTAGKELYNFPLPGKGWYRATFSADGQWLATDAGDGTIVLRDTATGKEVRRLKGHDQSLAALAFSPDGKRLMSSGHDHTLRVWDVAGGKEIRRWNLVPGTLAWGAFAPDGATLAVGGPNGAMRIRLLDVATGKDKTADLGHASGVTSLAFSPDGKLLASAAATHGDPGARLWDPATGKLLRTIQAHDLGAGSVAFSPDGKQLLTAGRCDGTMSLWDPLTGENRGRLEGPGPQLVNAVFTPDGKHILCGDGYNHNAAVGLFDVKTRQAVWQDRRASLLTACLVLSPDGELVARGSHGSYSPYSPTDVRYGLELWQTATGKAVPWPQAGGLSVRQLAFSPDSRLLAVGSDLATQMVEIATQQQIYRWPKCRSVAIAPRGRFAALGLPGGNIALYDLSTGKECLRLECSEARSLAFSPDGKRLASGMADTTILLWDVADLETLSPLVAAKADKAALEAWWADLGSLKAERAYLSGWELSAAGKDGVPFLREKLKALQEVSPEVAGLIADLGSDKFPMRDAAQKKLVKLGRAAEEALLQTLEKKPALEVAQRIEGILATLPKDGPSERLRTLRAIAVLEQTPGAEAAAALEAVADGSPSPVIAEKARQALKRRGQ
jgi:WD40 repeat protein